ncbi:hypothetical protein GUITHDRAFT_113326 [Guillardia theta CCMP2712]|uniref:RING-type domain-containing protein n=1 Tax=Guillardia theta (strain CCMP2712) TaxID=905079 RepID=L1IXG0_GUITC|nr:hypothetical protein GUITHDRAFT_113326 [Guillardia theta CCMP2712]EKX40540.1 hypothetical protein GUITHDRAFT_113326 [Guillardia theta CCMP2712]|eukprot:XP_005827520.1 hypothetical protein GUITHDRAFT_113326 [Guillardia theta CCMP2712]
MEVPSGVKEVEVFQMQEQAREVEEKGQSEQSNTPTAHDADAPRGKEFGGGSENVDPSAVGDVAHPEEDSSDLTCSICLEVLWDPIVIPSCKHTFCRNCVIKSMHSSPNGQQCPNCREDILVDPLTCKGDGVLQEKIELSLSAACLEGRRRSAEAELEELQKMMVHAFPIFYMHPGCRPGQRVQLYLFERRYREMCKRIAQTDNFFLFMANQPSSGQLATLVCLFLQTRKNLEVWIDESAYGLFYGKFTSSENLLSSGDMIVNPTEPPESAEMEVPVELPVFHMQGGSCRRGQPVSLHMFERRYRALARIVSSTNKMFIFASEQPRCGSRGIVVRVTHCSFRSDGTANISGRGIEEVCMQHLSEQSDYPGLVFAKCHLSSPDGLAALHEASRSSPARPRQSQAGRIIGTARTSCSASCVLM